MDRFLLKTVLDYPTEDEEIEIMQKHSVDTKVTIKKVLNKKHLDQIIKLTHQIHVSENIFEYVKDIVFTSRDPEAFELEELSKYIAFGASPRASLALIQCSKVLAMMHGRTFVIPEDIKEIAHDILRHRIIPSYEAIAEGITTDDIITDILDNTPIS